MDNIVRNVIEKAEKFNFKSNSDKRNWICQNIEKEVSNLVMQLVECYNSSMYHEDINNGIFRGLIGQHRYLQSEFINNLPKVLYNYSLIEYDGRNKQATELADRMAKSARS